MTFDQKVEWIRGELAKRFPGYAVSIVGGDRSIVGQVHYRLMSSPTETASLYVGLTVEDVETDHKWALWSAAEEADAWLKRNQDKPRTEWVERPDSGGKWRLTSDVLREQLGYVPAWLNER
jgi:hypothetical protein